MKHVIPFLIAVTLGTGAQAACFADYKAKREDPLRLHYGVVALPYGQCSVADAARHLTPRLARDGWILLNVLSTFDDSGLDERKESAGTFFLRY